MRISLVLLSVLLCGPLPAAEPAVSPAKSAQCIWERDTAADLAEQAKTYYAEGTFVAAVSPTAPPPPRTDRFLALLAQAWANRDVADWPMKVWTACIARQ